MSQFYISSTYLRILSAEPEVAAQVKALGFDLNQLTSEEFIASQHIKLLFHAFAQQGLNSLTLRYGEQFSVASHGPLGFAFLTAPNLRSAMQCLAEYTITRSSNYACEFIVDEHTACFRTHDQNDDALVQRWLAEAAMFVDLNLLKAYMAQPLADGLKLSFSFAAPNYADQLQQVLGAPCEFDAACTELSFPAAWCRISSPLSDPETHRSNLQKCRELKLRLATEQDAAAISKLALEQFFEARRAGQVRASELPDLEHLAKLQHCSVRTLARRLEASDCSYKQLLAETRQRFAVDLLKNTPLSIADIAEILTYKETANFVRAFKTWFHTTPAVWRKENYERKSLSIR